MSTKLIVTVSSIAGTAVSGYVIFRTLFKKPGHASLWGPGEVRAHLENHGVHHPHVSKTMQKIVENISSGAKNLTDDATDELHEARAKTAAVLKAKLNREAVSNETKTDGESVSNESHWGADASAIGHQLLVDSLGSEAAVKKALKIKKVNSSVVHLGTEDGEIDPTSKKYKKLIIEALEKSTDDPDYTLKVTGKTYGLGARGTVKEVDGIKVTEFDAKDILKLHVKLSA